MARKKRETEENEDAPSRKGQAKSLWPMIRFATLTVGVAVLVLLCGFVALEGEQLLSNDPRFRLAQEEPGSADPIEVKGARNASKAAILRVFEDDRGKSVYRIDLEARRKRVRGVEWVQDAIVRRIWPNQIVVEVSERTPVAFIQLPAGATGQFDAPVSYHPALIDAEGYILKSHVGTMGSLPMLTGVREQDPLSVRQDRVRRLMLLMRDLGPYKDRVQEVDLTEPDNVRITYDLGDRPAVLILGEERFQERLKTFLNHYPGIKDKLPEKAVFDVSLEGFITAVP
jgi:cell division protein FtsQ